MGWTSGEVLFPLLAGLLFLIVGVYVFSIGETIVHTLLGGLSAVSGAFLVFAAFTMSDTIYTVTDQGLLIQRPIAHRRLFPFAGMQVKKLSGDEAAKVFEDMLWKEEDMKARAHPGLGVPSMDMREYMSLKMSMANLFAYSSRRMGGGIRGMRKTSARLGGMTVYSKYEKARQIKVAATGEFVLLTTQDGSQFLLTPENADAFVAAVKKRTQG